MISSQVMDDLQQAREIMQRVSSFRPKGWSHEEQQRFWEALERFPDGSWTSIAEYIGTKNTRQAMTFSQKLRQKLGRWRRKRTWAWQMVQANRAAKQQEIDACFPQSPATPEEPSATAAFAPPTNTTVASTSAMVPLDAGGLTSLDSEFPATFLEIETDILLELCANWSASMETQPDANVAFNQDMTACTPVPGMWWQQMLLDGEPSLSTGC